MSGGYDEATAKRMAADVRDAAIAGLRGIKGKSSSTMIDCMLSAVSFAHIESMRVLVESGIDNKRKSKVSMLATIANAYSVAIMQLAQDGNTQWDDPVLFQGQLEHKIAQLFDNAKQFDTSTGSIL